MSKQYPFAVIHVYANNGVVSRHRKLEAAVTACQKMRRSLYSRPENQNAIAPWSYAIWNNECDQYVSVDPDTETWDRILSLEDPNRREMFVDDE